MSEPLTFGDLKIGDLFIGFPLDGDDSGHGGFRGKHKVFRKTRDGSVDYGDVLGTRYNMPDSMEVLRVDVLI